MDEANELRGSLQLIGTVKSVIFQNEENGYTVLRLVTGDGGGELVFAGTPEECAACPASFTGEFLKPALERYRK